MVSEYNASQILFYILNSKLNSFFIQFYKNNKASELSSFWIGHYPVVEVLLNHSANINVKNSDGTPVLNVASRRNGNKLKSVGASMFFPVF